MATIKYRGEVANVTDQIALTATFYNNFGVPANTVSFPQINITTPTGLMIFQTPTSAGVQQVDVGTYQYVFTVPYAGPYGVWQDVWSGSTDGINTTIQTLSFIVSNTEMPIANSDGYLSLGGDDPGFNYSQTAIRNINKILKAVKARLNSSGKSKSTDSFGNTIYVDCDIFSVDMLVTFIATSLSQFNQIPYFTFFTFDNTNIIDQFFEVLVKGAVLYALSSQALIERGREFQINDNGVSFTPPTLSEALMSEYNTDITNYMEEVKMIKNSMRPAPLGLGLLGMNSGINTQWARLRHLRSRRLF